jgi:hypothetical protein
VSGQNWTAPQSLDRTPTFRPVAGNEADMDVDTNTPRNGLHFLATQLFLLPFLFGRRLCIAYNGNGSIDVRPINWS